MKSINGTNSFTVRIYQLEPIYETSPRNPNHFKQLLTHDGRNTPPIAELPKTHHRCNPNRGNGGPHPPTGSTQKSSQELFLDITSLHQHQKFSYQGGKYLKNKNTHTHTDNSLHFTTITISSPNLNNTFLSTARLLFLSWGTRLDGAEMVGRGC